MKSRARRAAVVLPLALALGGCVTLQFEGGAASEPITDQQLDQIRAGETGLAACLAALGAPQLAYEQPRGSYALVWYWGDTFDWGFGFSVPFDEWTNASYRYTDTQNDRPGLLLLFDRNDVVQQLRRGPIGELAPLGKRKTYPQVEDDDEAR